MECIKNIVHSENVYGDDTENLASVIICKIYLIVFTTNLYVFRVK